MMSLIFYIIFLIPLCFWGFWFVQYYMFILMLILIKNLNFNYLIGNISYIYGYDGLSYMFILLSCWICSLMILSSFKVYYSNNFYQLFLFMVMFLFFLMFMLFSCLNLFMFYIYFEVSLIPLMILILGWGYQPERLMAGLYMIFYTIFFSLPMMVGLFKIFNEFYSMMFFEFMFFDSWIVYFLINMVFFVKMPLFGIHLWLPKAHVEAPISGSMILAGLTLKLGGYGLIRLMKMFMVSGLHLNLFFIIWGLMGGLIVSFICLFQTDIKSLIAYSSVAHMSMSLAGILSMNMMGFMGSLVLMLAHGLCSSGLFCMANIYYERLNTRSMYLLKGMINIFPNLGFFMFMLSINNMAAPPSLNLLGEILLLKGLIGYNNLLIIPLAFMSFMGAVYSIYLYTFSNHGMIGSSIYSFNGGLYREYLLLFLHWLPLNLLIIGDLFNFL